MTISSRAIRAGVAILALAALSGCVSGDRTMGVPFAGGDMLSGMFSFDEPSEPVEEETTGIVPALGYDAVDDGGFHLAAIPTAKMDPRYLRQQVVYDAGEYEPGTVIVDTPNRFLYVVEEGGMAMRYGISVGGSGFSWSGEATINAKRQWPSWHPPQEMIDRKPELEPYREGMEPGLQNPLGARALYLFQDGRDTLYRLHGTPEWWSIGTAVSSGCIRLTNQDIIDLYERIPMGARVVVKQGNEALVGEVDTTPAATVGETEEASQPMEEPADFATGPLDSFEQVRF